MSRVFVSQHYVEALIKDYRRIMTACDINSRHFDRCLCLLPTKGSFVELMLRDTDSRLIPFEMITDADVTAPFYDGALDEFNKPLIWGEIEFERIYNSQYDEAP